jgi:glycosyltransferase involved in cell wall biosynthesis
VKILILTDYYPPDKIGGVGEIAKNLKDSYDKKGHETWVLTTGSSSAAKRVVRSSPSLIKGVFLNNIKAIQLIRNNDIDIINAHQSTTTLFLLTKYIPFLYKKFPKVVNSFQVSYFSEFRNIKTVRVRGKVFRPQAKEYIEKWVFSPVHILLDVIGFYLSDAITVVSSENKKEFDQSYGRLSRKSINIIANGVNPNDFSPGNVSKNIDKDLLKKTKGKTVLLYAGVFRSRKRVFNLLFALESAVKKNEDVLLLLLGGGRGYEEDMLALIAELGLEDNVIFVGRVPNTEIVNYLRVCDVFCLLSSYEGMPIAILEAMSTGKAILTSSVSGMTDLVQDGKQGYLTSVDDIDEISEKLNMLVANIGTTKEYGLSSRQRILQNYTWEKIAEQYLDLFEETL